MFKIIVTENYDELSAKAFEVMKEVVTSKENPVLGLATGSSPIGLYQNMIKDHKENGTSYKNVVTFNLDEYIGLKRDHSQTYWTFMHENLFNGLDIPEENVHVPVGDSEDEEAECAKYEKAMENYQVDIQLLGIGANGHIGFNEPTDTFIIPTHKVTLKEDTIKANSRFFASIDDVPTQAVTMGIGTIFNARSVLLVANGKGKAAAIKAMLEGNVDPQVPASILKLHSKVYVVIDEDAASELTEYTEA